MILFESMTERSGASPISGRIPNVLYRWLEGKVEGGEYPNLNQALIGQLMRAKTLEEERENQKELIKLKSDMIREVIEEISKR
ncbi:hypothetical protein FGW20_06310 [Methanoculleus sp. FWC-SCC3]|uniref:Uncharacterized protein n=1 Tax=Methanoculleus methanifontis TaxID=2584086 RepID=A0ABT8M0W0_9EURY|nr:hypothetical protein [Methanoculleus sp. FWC-SCC3]MDN7012657.1 hypothetical protein [Methanoculleus sp. FWC-SCC3]